MGLTRKTLQKIGKSEKVKGMLADLYDKKVKSVNRWIEENDPILTTIDSLRIIESELGIPLKDAVE